ncbi:flavoprotein [Dactylosporangium sp. NPDC005555]|uniref:flavoprotein n=1 Tax=Dactylosporangium sp. NPDC005555 TaxID=3154889 RepID=UPI0033BC8A0F
MLRFTVYLAEMAESTLIGGGLTLVATGIVQDAPGAGKLLCVVVCGAGPAPRVGALIGLAQAAGWSVRVVATPSAVGFLDTAGPSAGYGVDVRSEFRAAAGGGPRSPHADAVIVAPATYNTINKLAAGVNDTYALNVVAEAIGRGTPVVVLPFVNAALAARRPFVAAVESLRSEGVRVLLGPGQWQPHEPGSGDRHLAAFPWRAALAALPAVPDVA